MAKINDGNAILEVNRTIPIEQTDGITILPGNIHEFTIIRENIDDIAILINNLEDIFKS